LSFNLQVAKEELGNKPKKKGGQTKEGIARCTFEDKILMSDIVFLRAWTQVEVPQFYNPLTTALQPRDQTWKGMRTVAELRRDHNLPIPVNKDSLYKVCSCFVPIHVFIFLLPGRFKTFFISYGYGSVSNLYLIFLFLFFFSGRKLKGNLESSIHW
jgi:hypothetical protein